MRCIAPSIFPTVAHESRSKRFQPIPTIEILRGLTREGFVPVGTKQSSSRIEGKGAFTKRLSGFVASMTARSTMLAIRLRNPPQECQ